MLTRIEIDGFKSFEDFSLDLGPLVVILGANACGKSNLFDAIQLLSRLATKNVHESILDLRGDFDDLFRQRTPGNSCDLMMFAVELLIDPVVVDPWMSEVELTHTRIRYEVDVLRERDERGRTHRLRIVREAAHPIRRKDDRWKPGAEPVPSDIAVARSFYSARKSAFLDTVEEEGKRKFQIHQDRRQGKTRSAHAAAATVLSSITEAEEFPHLFALREEMRSWRFLQLDPAGLRKPSKRLSPEFLSSDGSNLAAVLARVQGETSSKDRPTGILAEIASELAEVIPDVLGIAVVEDHDNEEFRASIELRDGFVFPTRVISDGTLRVLALLTILHDPRHRGLICFEEPENGIHPARLKTLVHRLRNLVSDLHDPSDQAPMSQLLMNSHSPVVLSTLREEAADNEAVGGVYFADLVSVADPATGEVRRKTRMRPVGSGQGDLFPHAADAVPVFEVSRYLSSVHQSLA